MIDKNNLPRHVAIIMDGNGRWAQNRKLARTSGHLEGVKRVKEVIKAAAESGIKVLTLFAFSTENWVRPKKEINFLMRYLDNFLMREVNQMHKNNIRFMVIGKIDRLPESIQKKIENAQNKTKDNSGLTVVLALNYGSRQEIVDAAKGFAQDCLSGLMNLKDLDEKAFGRYLYTKNIPDPDLLIRTSAELRISNFLLWQLSYTELYFPDKLWPDFSGDDLKLAIKEYQLRKRRFGGIENVS